MAAQAQRFLRSRTRWALFIGLLVISFYLLAVTPLHTYWQQRQYHNAAEQRYELLASQNKSLENRIGQLQTDAEIQRLAREQYELVPPGAQAYAVMPPPNPTPPADANQKKKKSVWSKIGDTVTFWN